MKKKVIIFSAPSGSGKSTIVNYLLAKDEVRIVKKKLYLQPYIQ